MASLFDMKLRAMRRDRAARLGPALFLLERVFDDVLERIALTGRRFERALLVGCPDSDWPSRLAAAADEIEVRDPGALFAAAAGGTTIDEDSWQPEAARYDLVIAIGTLDTVDGLNAPWRGRRALHGSTRDGRASARSNEPRARRSDHQVLVAGLRD